MCSIATRPVSVQRIGEIVERIGQDWAFCEEEERNRRGYDDGRQFFHSYPREFERARPRRRRERQIGIAAL